MTDFTASDHQYMTQALSLAQQGLYSATPNPRVGCVIVKDGVVIGEGAHLKSGTPHAEIHALNQAHTNHKNKLTGATAYVTLEPCGHYGKTPPCAEALVSANVMKVVIAMADPNPLVAGQGVAYLQSHGINVLSGLMQKQARQLNAGFVQRMTQQLPLVRSKIAASLDGKTALTNRKSQWITGANARTDVQKWRAQSCAIMTGVGTVLEDNPSLNVRDPEIRRLLLNRQPLKVIVDSQLRSPSDAKIFQTGRTLIAYANDPNNKVEQLIANNIELLCLPNSKGKVCLKSLFNHLASNEINELLVEAGEGLNGALIAEDLIDEVIIYYATKLMGSQGKGMFDFPALSAMEQAIPLQLQDVRQIGNDIRLIATLKHST